MDRKEAVCYFGVPDEDVDWVRRTLPVGAHPKVWHKMITGASNALGCDPEQLAEKKSRELDEHRKRGR